MSGLLIGILAARTVSGVVGSTLGWRTMYGIAAAVMVALAVSLKVLYEFGGTICGMVVGVILLDLGAQSAHVSNQSRIYAIRPEARSRMNTAYMVAYFVGGSLGSYGGAWGWGRGGWGGVCLVGLGMTVAGLIVFVATAGVRLTGDRISISGS